MKVVKIILKNIKNFFKFNYMSLVSFITVNLMQFCAKMMAHLIHLQGKNPNYVSLPSLKEQILPFNWGANVNKLGGNRPMKGEGVWIKDATQHPVLLSREKFYNKQVELASEILSVKNISKLADNIENVENVSNSIDKTSEKK